MLREAPQFTFPVSLANVELLTEIIRLAFENSVLESFRNPLAVSVSARASLKLADATVEAALAIFVKNVAKSLFEALILLAVVSTIDASSSRVKPTAPPPPLTELVALLCAVIVYAFELVIPLTLNVLSRSRPPTEDPLL